jgi:hypothetical protein
MSAEMKKFRADPPRLSIICQSRMFLCKPTRAISLKLLFQLHDISLISSARRQSIDCRLV